MPLSSAPAQLFEQSQQMASRFSMYRQTQSGLIIPKSATPVFRYGFSVVPAYGTQVQLVEYDIPVGMFSLVCGIVLQFAGTGPAPNPGDVSFTVDIDKPLGSAATVGYTEIDYASVPFLLGSFVYYPWQCEFRHQDGETIRIKATPVANMGTGAGNFLLGALLGFEWPKGSRGYEG